MPDLPENTFIDKSSPEPLVLIKADSPYFAIVDYNDAFQAASHTTGRDIVGVSMTELHKWNSENEESALMIHDLMNETIRKRETNTLPAVRYDLPAEDGRPPEASWWQAIYQPIFDADGKVIFLLCTTKNITAAVLAQEKTQ